MGFIAMLIPIISGIIGGNVAGSALKKFSLGPVGNSIVGLLGGAGGAAILAALGVGGAETNQFATQASSIDFGTVVSGILGGGVGGGVLMSIVGLIKERFTKPS